MTSAKVSICSRRHFLAKTGAAIAVAGSVSQSISAIAAPSRPLVSQSPIKLTSIPATALDEKSIGHIRHMVHLANMLPGDWSEMGDGAIEFLGVPERSLRYQLATMAHALASVQYNRTPAYREIYQSTILALFNRLLEPDCWKEWVNVSRGGKSQGTEFGMGWVDPIKRHNVMYGGHVLQVAAIYDSLYHEGRFTQPGSIVLDFPERSWGLGRQKFVYDIASMTENFYNQFAELNYEGFPCEPTASFPECPQHAVLGMILADRLVGGDFGVRIRKNYLEGIQRAEFLSPDTNSFRHYLRLTDRKFVGEEAHIWSDGWTGTYMYAWAPDYIRPLYADHRNKHLPGILDRRLTGVPKLMPDALMSPGWMAQYAAELGDTETKKTVLDFADQNLKSIWRDGRYYYPRNDDLTIDRHGVYRANAAWQGNALLAFGRLNVGDGLLRLHNAPWEKSKLAEPHIANVDYLAAGVSEAIWHAKRKELVMAFLPGPLATTSTTFLARNLPLDGRAMLVRDSGTPEPIEIGNDGAARISFDPRKQARFALYLK